MYRPDLEEETLQTFGTHHFFHIIHESPDDCPEDAQFICCNYCGHIIMGANTDEYLEEGFLSCIRHELDWNPTCMWTDLTVSDLAKNRNFDGDGFRFMCLGSVCDYNLCMACYTKIKNIIPHRIIYQEI